MELNSELKNKLNKHEDEQSEKTSDLKKITFFLQLNIKEIVTCTQCGFSVPSFNTKLPKETEFTSLNELNCSCCCFGIDHSLKSLHL